MNSTPRCAAANPFQKTKESLPSLQCVVCSFIGKEKDRVDVRFDFSLLRPIRVVASVKAAECEEIRSGLIQSVLLCAWRNAKAFKSEHVLHALHNVTVRYPFTRKNFATLVATVAPRVLVITLSAVAECLAMPTAENPEWPEIKATNRFGPIEALFANIAGDGRYRYDFTR